MFLLVAVSSPVLPQLAVPCARCAGSLVHTLHVPRPWHLRVCREIPTIVRSLGLNPSTAQLQSLQQAIAAAVAAAAEAGGAAVPPAASSGTSYVALEQCESLMATWMLEMKDSLQRDDFHVLMRAFQALDPDNRSVIQLLTQTDKPPHVCPHGDCVGASLCSRRLSHASGRMLHPVVRRALSREQSTPAVGSRTRQQQLSGAGVSLQAAK